ncbi:Calvin cycle protein CP12 [Synechocystis sp. FACHB-383]|uniref:Calvin cycle protein CP12 n=1 Tax=Synechocystis sp. FACHB-383 TaxID=2692864 RepID=UPI00168305E9|nr:Calvin cycle protein CP12 [Synechocystis sp. FACHB-383]MBD2654129.1 Calvin cycle protein CP12 [Synechocystis sp. FACHB-383]
MSYLTITPVKASQPATILADNVNVSATTLDNRLKAALEHARRITEIYGLGSLDAVLAWETVEELQQVDKSLPKNTPHNSFTHYCTENPSALEARIYDV